MKNTILASDSIVQKIWNSHVFTAWFERHCKEMEAAHGKVRNLRAAKHRFESFSKPLGRVILWLPALLATARDIAIQREGAPEGQVAHSWLQHVTSEMLVTLAMLADAGDEGMTLVRQVDDEQADIGCLQRVVAEFLDRARFLWQEGGCLTSEGYTKHCLDLLCEGLPVFNRSTVQVLHKPSETTMDRCLMRMRCWLRLAEETLQAEFPHCHLLRAFSVFDVQDAPADRGHWAQTHRGGLLKLAAAFNIDGPQLCAELADHQPIAAAIAREAGCGNRRAWQRALDRTQRTQASREAHPAEALLPTLQRYLAWTCSSSGVEQNFSVAERLRFGRGPATEATEALQLKAALDKRPPEEHARVCARARELYADVFGPTRGQRSGARIDRGTRRRKRRPNTEAAWLRRRRLSVTEALAKRSTPLDGHDYDVQQLAGWSGRHEKERQAQRKKARKREEEAARDGYLTELTQDLAAAVQRQIRVDLKADASLANKARCQELANGIMRRNLPWESLCGRRAWVGSGSKALLVRETLVMRGLAVTQDRFQAEVFALEDVGQPGERISWLAALRGALLVSFQQVLNCKGVFIQHVPAISVRREVFISAKFTSEHEEITRMVQTARTWPDSLWTCLLTEDQFRARCLEKAARKWIVALACASEASKGLGRRWPVGVRVFHKKKFLEFITKFDLSKSGGGRG